MNVEDNYEFGEYNEMFNLENQNVKSINVAEYFEMSKSKINTIIESDLKFYPHVALRVQNVLCTTGLGKLYVVEEAMYYIQSTCVGMEVKFCDVRSNQLKVVKGKRDAIEILVDEFEPFQMQFILMPGPYAKKEHGRQLYQSIQDGMEDAGRVLKDRLQNQDSVRNEDKLAKEDMLSREDKLAKEDKLSREDKRSIQDSVSDKDKLRNEDKWTNQESLPKKDKLHNEDKLQCDMDHEVRELVYEYVEAKEGSVESYKIAKQIRETLGYPIGAESRRQPCFKTDRVYRKTFLLSIMDVVKRINLEKEEIVLERQKNTKAVCSTTDDGLHVFTDTETGDILHYTEYEKRYKQYIGLEDKNGTENAPLMQEPVDDREDHPIVISQNLMNSCKQQEAMLIQKSCAAKMDALEQALFEQWDQLLLQHVQQVEKIRISGMQQLERLENQISKPVEDPFEKADAMETVHKKSSKDRKSRRRSILIPKSLDENDDNIQAKQKRERKKLRRRSIVIPSKEDNEPFDSDLVFMDAKSEPQPEKCQLCCELDVAILIYPCKHQMCINCWYKLTDQIDDASSLLCPWDRKDIVGHSAL